ncbi:stAR-related lipid transfer protein 7, mitochondrial-like [Ylistrum balloti]|uniref:stAR-related lipid transfer protein 7, mitochondrial-like n=1 Tax=Ylistrum balloti TaxID=509963 RepID=UPI002905EAF0|nr:stAR-related lipid transfer protein 7, mitochondrial-like [Ylistrum balloti]
MSVDNLFLQLRILTHRLLSNNKKKTQQILFKRATTLAEKKGDAFWQTAIVRKLLDQFGILNDLTIKQCNGVVAQRLRRTTQILFLYRRVYGESVVRIINRFSDPFMRNGKIKSAFCLYGAALFSWQNNQLTDSDLESCIEDMKHIQDMLNADSENGAGSDVDNGSQSRGNENNVSQGDSCVSRYLETWSCVMNNPNFKLWSKPVEGSRVEEYKVYGTYHDITPMSFYTVQVDLQYRKKWDKRVVKLDVVDQDKGSGAEIVHWVTKFVWPMADREYVFMRRYKIDRQKNVMVLMSHSTDHPSIPESKKCVRITKYESDLVIKPHTNFNENGFDYVLTYYDDPESSIPSVAYEWVATQGLPKFLEEVHTAARNLQETNQNQNSLSNNDSNSNQNSLSKCDYTPTIAQYC